MKVYIVTHAYHYEGTDIISVHSTFEAAQKSMYETVGIKDCVGLATYAKDENHLTYDSQTTAIETWGVDESN